MTPSDLDFLRKVQQGDEAAFAELVDRHARPLYRVAYALVGNAADAEDVLQETFLGAFKAAAGFREESSVKTWLARILVRQAALLLRQPARRVLRLHNPLTGEAGDAGAGRAGQSPAADADRRLDLAEALEALSPEHRQVLVLREFEQMRYEEIAAVLGLPRGTVESRLYRARQELKRRLKGYQP